jgi:hypothetical protein
MNQVLIAAIGALRLLEGWSADRCHFRVTPLAFPSTVSCRVRASRNQRPRLRLYLGHSRWIRGPIDVLRTTRLLGVSPDYQKEDVMDIISLGATDGLLPVNCINRRE